MRVALVHDHLTQLGGAERVLEALYELYPEVHVYTSVFLSEFLGPHRDRFEKMHIHSDKRRERRANTINEKNDRKKELVVEPVLDGYTAYHTEHRRRQAFQATAFPFQTYVLQ